MVVVQFIPTTYNQNELLPANDFLNYYKAPIAVNNKILISCYDCHSNNTNYPWYSKIQPAAMFLEQHIEEGKAELNLSEWPSYSERRKKSKIKSIISQLKDDEMPLYSYTLIHQNASFTRDEKLTVISWLEKIADSINKN
jgi:hypothetical protein